MRAHLPFSMYPSRAVALDDLETEVDPHSLRRCAEQAVDEKLAAAPADILPRNRVEFRISGRELPYLLADWLNELLFTFESRRLLLSRFEVAVGPNGLRATAQGEAVDEHRHVLEHEVKAVTYHGLRVEQTNGDWIAEVILDI